jgi:hypothetical protein
VHSPYGINCFPYFEDLVDFCGDAVSTIVLGSTVLEDLDTADMLQSAVCIAESLHGMTLEFVTARSPPS